MSETPSTTTTSQKKYCNTPLICIAIRLQFVLQCFRCPYALRKGKSVGTPRICIAVRLPFVLQYASHLYRSAFGKILVVAVTGMSPSKCLILMVASVVKNPTMIRVTLLCGRMWRLPSVENLVLAARSTAIISSWSSGPRLFIRKCWAESRMSAQSASCRPKTFTSLFVLGLPSRPCKKKFLQH